MRKLKASGFVERVYLEFRKAEAGDGDRVRSFPLVCSHPLIPPVVTRSSTRIPRCDPRKGPAHRRASPARHDFDILKGRAGRGCHL